MPSIKEIDPKLLVNYNTNFIYIKQPFCFLKKKYVVHFIGSHTNQVPPIEIFTWLSDHVQVLSNVPVPCGQYHTTASC